jgi:hypothetical protein
MIPVRTDLAPFRAAVAELPARARLADDPAGAVVVVPGSAGWCAAAAAAFAAGAVAVVVDDPAPEADARLAALSAHAGARPVILSRTSLRHDVVADAVGGPGGVRTAPAAGVAEVTGRASALPGLVRDAVGWLRTLTGGPIEFVAASTGDGSSVAGLRSLTGAGPVPHSLVAVAGPVIVPRLRVTVLADVRTGVVVDHAARATCLTWTDEAGEHTSPRRFEAPERLALRRALAAIADAEACTDLADLRHDDELAHRILVAASTPASA